MGRRSLGQYAKQAGDGVFHGMESDFGEEDPLAARNCPCAFFVFGVETDLSDGMRSRECRTVNRIRQSFGRSQPQELSRVRVNWQCRWEQKRDRFGRQRIQNRSHNQVWSKGNAMHGRADAQNRNNIHPVQGLQVRFWIPIKNQIVCLHIRQAQNGWAWKNALSFISKGARNGPHVETTAWCPFRQETARITRRDFRRIRDQIQG